jgi:hypothetical protein
MNEIKKLWNQHVKVDYPLDDETLIINKVDLYKLNHIVNEIVDEYIKNEWDDLTLENQQVLVSVKEDLYNIIPKLSGDNLIYFKRLYLVVNLVLNESNTKFPARLHVLVARNGNNAIVIRRGPSKQVCTFEWNRKTNAFTQGQWLKKARIFERRSDISANGKYWIYFALDGRWNSKTKGSWTAIAKTPWLKAITLYAKGDGWNGGGLFSYDNVYWLNDGYGHKKIHQSNLVKRNCEYTPKSNYGGECPYVYYNRLQRDGWNLVETIKLGKWREKVVFEREMSRGWLLRKNCHEQVGSPIGKGCYWDEHELINKNGEVVSQPDWEWAEWIDGSIIFAEFGKLYQLNIINTSELKEAKLLHDFNDYKFKKLSAPY